MWVILWCLPEKGRRETEKIVEEMKEREQGRKRKMNESEETEEIKNILPLPLPALRIAGLAQP